jgi:hypothetical protein
VTGTFEPLLGEGLAMAAAGTDRATATAMRDAISRAGMGSVSARPGKAEGPWNGRGRARRPALFTDMDLLTASYQVLLTQPPPVPEQVLVTAPLVLVSVNVSGAPPEPAETATSV